MWSNICAYKFPYLPLNFSSKQQSSMAHHSLLSLALLSLLYHIDCHGDEGFGWNWGYNTLCLFAEETLRRTNSNIWHLEQLDVAWQSSMALFLTLFFFDSYQDLRFESPFQDEIQLYTSEHIICCRESRDNMNVLKQNWNSKRHRFRRSS